MHAHIVIYSPPGLGFDQLLVFYELNFFCPCTSASIASSQTAQLKCNSDSATAIDRSQGLPCYHVNIFQISGFFFTEASKTPGHNFESLQSHYTHTIAKTVVPADNCIGKEYLFLYPKKGNDSQIKCRMEQWLKQIKMFDLKKLVRNFGKQSIPLCIDNYCSTTASQPDKHRKSYIISNFYNIRHL